MSNFAAVVRNWFSSLYHRPSEEAPKTTPSRWWIMPELGAADAISSTLARLHGLDYAQEVASVREERRFLREMLNEPPTLNEGELAVDPATQAVYAQRNGQPVRLGTAIGPEEYVVGTGFEPGRLIRDMHDRLQRRAEEEFFSSAEAALGGEVYSSAATTASLTPEALQEALERLPQQRAEPGFMPQAEVDAAHAALRSSASELNMTQEQLHRRFEQLAQVPREYIDISTAGGNGTVQYTTARLDAGPNRGGDAFTLSNAVRAVEMPPEGLAVTWLADMNFGNFAFAMYQDRRPDAALHVRYNFRWVVEAVQRASRCNSIVALAAYTYEEAAAWFVANFPPHIYNQILQRTLSSLAVFAQEDVRELIARAAVERGVYPNTAPISVPLSTQPRTTMNDEVRQMARGLQTVRTVDTVPAPTRDPLNYHILVNQLLSTMTAAAHVAVRFDYGSLLREVRTSFRHPADHAIYQLAIPIEVRSYDRACGFLLDMGLSRTRIQEIFRRLIAELRVRAEAQAVELERHVRDTPFLLTSTQPATSSDIGNLLQMSTREPSFYRRVPEAAETSDPVAAWFERLDYVAIADAVYQTCRPTLVIEERYNFRPLLAAYCRVAASDANNGFPAFQTYTPRDAAFALAGWTSAQAAREAFRRLENAFFMHAPADTHALAELVEPLFDQIAEATAEAAANSPLVRRTPAPRQPVPQHFATASDLRLFLQNAGLTQAQIKSVLDGHALQYSSKDSNEAPLPRRRLLRLEDTPVNVET